MEKPTTLILVGPPGSGKSTQAGLLVAQQNAIHVDVGFALRKEAETGSPLGVEISDVMNNRMGLVPDRIVERVLSKALSSVDTRDLVVLDGAPRRAAQVRIIEAVLRAFNRKVDWVVSIVLPERESIERISRRWHCASCKRSLVAGADFSPENPACPNCGSHLSRRLDDTEEGIRKRYQVFLENTAPVVDHYRQRGVLLEVDGLKDSGQIFRDICKGLGF